MKAFIFCAIALSLLAGCNKKGVSYTVKGTVSDLSFNSSPGAGVQVNLYQTPAGGDENLAQSVTTGSDGSYSFDIKREKIEAFRITFTKGNYFPVSQSFTLEDLDAKKDNIFNASMNAKAWVKLTFKNTNPNESIAVTRTQGLTGCAECCSYSSFTLSGITDTSFVCLNTGNMQYGYTWTYIGGANFFENVINSAPLDTTELPLNF